MELEYYIPSPQLRPYIKLYALFNIRKEEILEPIKFLPMGYVYLILNFGDSFFIQRPGLFTQIDSTAMILVGQQETYHQLIAQGDLQCVCTIFQPSGMYRLLGVPVHELRCYGYQAELVLGNRLEKLYEKVYLQHPDGKNLIKAMDVFYTGLLTSANLQYRYVDLVLDCIHASRGLMGLKELTCLANISGRTFRRRFLELVGTSCIRYITITRLKSILHTLRQPYPPEIQWSKLAYGMGYYDQMHFIKSFKQMTGETPGRYLSRYNSPDHMLERYFMAAID